MIISVGYFSLIAGRLTVVVLKDTVFVDNVGSNKLDVLWYVCLRGAYSGGSHLKKYWMINPRSKVKVPPSNSRGDILIKTSLDWGWPSEEFSLVGRIQLCCRPPWLPPPSRQTPPPWWFSSIKWKQPALPTFAGGWSRPCAPSPPRSRWTRRPTSRSPAAGRPPPPRSWSRIQDHLGSSGPPRSADQARKMLLRGESVTSQDGENGQDGKEGVCIAKANSAKL